MPAYRVFNIQWDTDNHPAAALGLPSEHTVEVDDPEEEIADALSDAFGWCVLGCEYQAQGPQVTVTIDRPRVKLLGINGNAFSLMAAAARAARKAGWTREQIEALHAECMKGSYDELLQTLMRHFEVE